MSIILGQGELRELNISLTPIPLVFGQISGRVLRWLGPVLPGVKILAYGLGNHYYERRYTDSNGEFQFDQIPIYEDRTTMIRLDFTKAGFRQQIKHFDLSSSNSVIVVEIYLKEE